MRGLYPARSYSEIIVASVGSVGYPARCQAPSPPFSTRTFCKPSDLNASAARTLETSLGQTQ